MAKAIGYGADDVGEGELNGFKGYNFTNDSNLRIPPAILCNYLRRIQGSYRTSNPYHNAIHAADVVQSTHVLLQLLISNTKIEPTRIQLFSILLAAAVHDVDHPGQTNTYQENAKTDLALTYNDVSILENRHASHAFKAMWEPTALSDCRSPSQEKQQRKLSKKGSSKLKNAFKRRSSSKTKANDEHQNTDLGSPSQMNLLCNVNPTQIKSIRSNIIDAILHTDMSKHFVMVNDMKARLSLEKNGQQAEPSEDTISTLATDASQTWKILTYILHMADISGQAKGDPLFKLWTDRCLEEFFLQGDQEREMGLPVSPNCDRRTTQTAEAQWGFVQYVILPAYEVLGQLVYPSTGSDDRILPIVKSNLEYWRLQKEQK